MSREPDLLNIICGKNKPVKLSDFDSIRTKVEEVFGLEIRETSRKKNRKNVHLIKTKEQKEILNNFAAKSKKIPKKSNTDIILHRIILPVNIVY